MGEKRVDFNPDRNPSFSPYDITAHGADLRWTLEVAGVGTLVIIVKSDSNTGRIIPHSLNIADPVV